MGSFKSYQNFGNARTTFLEGNIVKNYIPGTFLQIPGIEVKSKEDVTEGLKGFSFNIFYHPYIELLVKAINEQGLYSLFNGGLLDMNDRDASGDGTVFKNVYNPNTSLSPDKLVQQPLPVEEFNFDINKPLAKDNWFTFYHLIVLVVETLLANNKNDDAIQWIENCLFDPKAIQIDVDTKHPNARFWKLPVFKNTVIESTTRFFNEISKLDLQNLIESLNRDPFNPFLVAYYRPQEFMMYVVNLYVKAHIAQGDINFRMAYNGGGMDYLNLALEYYKIAKIMLGEQIQTIPNILKKKPETYQSLKTKAMDPDVNAKVQYENIFPFCSQTILKTGDTSNGSLLGGGLTFYFSVPPDNGTQELYRLIDDRLLKLRNCQDIDGIIRKIDLFGTPINPGQLLAALAKGLSLGDILGGLYAPSPIYRYNFLLQKATEVCNEVKALGNAIVGALEKNEAEQLSVLRATHELKVLNRLSPIKERQVFESNVQKQALFKTRETAEIRLSHYHGLLGINGPKVPVYKDLPPEINADSSLPVDTIITPAVTDVDVSLVDSGERGVKIIPKEQQEISLLNVAATKHDDAGDNELIAGYIHALPDLSLHTAPFGGGFTLGYGSANIAAIYTTFARDAQNSADKKTHDSVLAAKFGSYIRREQEWTLQANLAEREIIQIDKQLAAADIRIQIAQQELLNHAKQIEESQEIQDFLINKESNVINYQQIINKLLPIHKNFYDLAMYYARSAEQAYQFEKPEKVIDFISYNYDNSIVGCTTVADRLLASLKEMEKSYLLDSPRPLEMKLSIQLSRLDPIALLQLRKSGLATFNLPEWLLLLKNRGIYNAKWISVNFTFPMISGPYTNMNALVTMQNNYIRIKPDGGSDPQSFPRKTDQKDDRFVQNNTPFKEILVSIGMNDQGYNLDSQASANEIYQQQYHPFDHAGFISEWTIDLNSKTPNYDFSELNWDSLTDVIISGVLSVEIDNGQFKSSAEGYLKSLFAQLSGEPLMLFLDINRDFSNELHRFKSDNSLQTLSLSFDSSRFPYIAQNKKITLTGLTVVTADDLSAKKSTMNNLSLGFTKDNSNQLDNYNIFIGQAQIGKIAITLEKDPIRLNIDLDKNLASDTYAILEYKIE